MYFSRTLGNSWRLTPAFSQNLEMSGGEEKGMFKNLNSRNKNLEMLHFWDYNSHILCPSWPHWVQASGCVVYIKENYLQALHSKSYITEAYMSTVYLISTLSPKWDSARTLTWLVHTIKWPCLFLLALCEMHLVLTALLHGGLGCFSLSRPKGDLCGCELQSELNARIQTGCHLCCF